MKLTPIAAFLSAVLLAGCASSGGYSQGYSSGTTGSVGGYGQSAKCADCGTISRIMILDSGRTAPSATGAVLGGLVGAVAGHEISDHTGGSRGNKNVSAGIGAVAGAVAGNKVQQNSTGVSYDITIRMDDGRVVVVNQKNAEGLSQNTRVRVNGSRVTAL